MSDEISLKEYAEQLEELDKKAFEQFPYDPKECTHHLSVGRQMLYVCHTCPHPNAICYTCNIKCHTDHDTVEIGSKRNYTCDCGTDRTNFPCTVRGIEEIESSDNSKFSHNFYNKFCVCDSEYDESRDMIQCGLGAACDEDWFHHECILGGSGDESGLEENESNLFICWQCVEQEDLEFLRTLGAVKCAIDRETMVDNKRKRTGASFFMVDDYPNKLAESKSDEVAKLLKKFPFLGDNESNYERPDDEVDTDNVISHFLGQLPYNQALSHIEGYRRLTTQLQSFLQSRDNSQAVSLDEMKEFFGSFFKKSRRTD